MLCLIVAILALRIGWLKLPVIAGDNILVQKPLSGAPKARGLTAKARTERSWMLPRSDTV